MVKHATRIIRNQAIKQSNKKRSTTKTFESSISATMRFSFFLKNKFRFARRSLRFGVKHIPIRHRKKKRGKLSSLLSYFVPWNKSSKFIFPTTSKLLSSQNVWRLPCLAEWGFFFAIRFWNDPGYEMILLDFPHFLSHIGFSPKKKVTAWTSLSFGTKQGTINRREIHQNYHTFASKFDSPIFPII